MDWTVSYDDERNLVRAIQRGEFTMEDQSLFLRDIFAHQRWSPGMPLLILYGDLEVGDLRAAQVESISSVLGQMESNLTGSRMALCCRTDLQFGLGRQFEMMAGNRIKGEIRVFRDEELALEWLSGT